MYNRYIGNTGKVSRIDDSPRATSSKVQPQPSRKREHFPENKNSPSAAQRGALPAANCQRPPSPLSGLSGIASEIMRKLSPASFEMEDILLILILWLLYKESGDEELLFTMIALFLV